MAFPQGFSRRAKISPLAISLCGQTHRKVRLSRYDWISQKSFDCACTLGPWIVPAKQIPECLGIKLWVNDVLKQDSHTSKMIFSLAEQIVHLSARLTLHPGDLILRGTPAGVGLARKEFLNSGDVVRVWIDRIGALSNTLV